MKLKYMEQLSNQTKQKVSASIENVKKNIWKTISRLNIFSKYTSVGGNSNTPSK